MNRTLSIIFILLNLTPGVSADSWPPPEINTLSIKVYSQIEPISAKVIELPPLPLASLPYLPMGSHPNAYAPANCTWGAASMKPTVPNNWGNAAEWADHARAEGKTVSDVPVVGAVAQHGGGYGHVAVVVGLAPGQVEITEMNYDWNGSVRTDWQPISTYQYIYI